jgi:hypothetical protein
VSVHAPAERFDIGRILSRMAGVLSRNFRVLAVLALLLSGLPSLLLAVSQRGLLAPLGSVVSDAAGAGWLLNLVIGALLQAALIHGTISDLNARPVTLADCLGTAVRHVLPLIGIGIATTVAIFFGFLFFIVPGVILALALCVAAPVRVVEGLGVFNSMGRSGDLTRGHRGAILLLFILYGVGLIVVQSLAAVLFTLTSFGSPDTSLSRLVLAPLLQAIGALIGAAGVASIYFELRTIKEGVGIEALAAAFD